MSIDPPLRAAPLLAVWPRARRIQLALRHILHEADVIILGQVSVFLQIGTFMLWHTVEKVFNELVRNQRVPEIQFGDIGL